MTAKVRDMMEPSLISMVQIYANHPIYKAKEYLGPNFNILSCQGYFNRKTQSSLSDVI